ncbi:MAG: SDR family oxidoreductase [Chloroflexi bacterium]|nr:SDR family oxidoreductase [Chloroflexota bacterium]
MDLGLKDKVVIITGGGGRGMGTAICKVFGAEGAKVCVSDYFEDRAKATAEEIKAAGGQAIGVGADVTKVDQVEAMVKKVVDTWGTVHVLCNHAGTLPERPAERRGTEGRYFAQQTKVSWEPTIDIPVYGVLNCCKAVISYMINQKYGKIVNTISDSARVGEPTMAVYGGAKAFVVAFSKGLAKENARFRINVNCVSPSRTTRIEGKEDEKILAEEQQYFEFYPLSKGRGRLGRPVDIANAYAFLASDRAEWITGQMLSVNGGYCMTS